MKNKPSTHKNTSVPTVRNLIEVLQRCYHPSQPIAFSLWSAEDVRSRLMDISGDEEATATDEQVADILELLHDEIAEDNTSYRLDSLVAMRLLRKS